MSKEFNIKLTVDDVRCGGRTVYNTFDFMDRYGAGNIHSGATFPATITLDIDTAKEFKEMMDGGLQVVFWTMQESKEMGSDA